LQSVAAAAPAADHELALKELHVAGAAEPPTQKLPAGQMPPLALELPAGQ
jgi:hypothetical protein